MKTYKEFSEHLYSEGFMDWWNKGKNLRVPNENQASWKDLMKDDVKQLTRSDKSFKAGDKGIRGLRPLKAFTPRMIRTGPTPAVRQAVERPLRSAKKVLQVGGAIGTALLGLDKFK